MNDSIRLGVIGCGAIVQAVHLPALARIGAIKVTAFAEVDDRRRGEAGTKLPGAMAHVDWRKIVDDAAIDAVLIGLPTAMHAECAIAALDAGKHVYLEKPIATTIADAERVVAAWRRSGRIGMIGFNYRYAPLYAELRRQIAAGRIGEVVALRSAFSTTVAQVPPWKRSRATGGGVLLDLGSHHVDLLPHLIGSPIRAVSSSIRSVLNDEDTATLEMQFANGVAAQSFFSLASIEEDKVEIYGRGGKLSVDRHASLAVTYEPPLRTMSPAAQARRALLPMTQIPAKVRKVLARGYEPSYAEAFATFARSIGERAQPSPSLADGLQSLAAIEAAERSAAAGGVIELTECAPSPFASPARIERMELA